MKRKDAWQILGLAALAWICAILAYWLALLVYWTVKVLAA